MAIKNAFVWLPEEPILSYKMVINLQTWNKQWGTGYYGATACDLIHVLDVSLKDTFAISIIVFI